MEDTLIWRGGLKAGWIAAIFDAQLQIANEVSAIKLPFLTLHGTADTLVDVASSQFLMDNSQSEDKTFEVSESFSTQYLPLPNIDIRYCTRGNQF